MLDNRLSLVIGGVIPVVLIVVVMPLIAGIHASIFGMPLLFAYMFALFPITSLCMWIAWRIDSPRYPRNEDSTEEIAR